METQNVMNPQPDSFHALPEPRKELGEIGMWLKKSIASRSIVAPSGCIEWKSSKTKRGNYGRATFKVAKLGRKIWRVHRLSYLLFNGELSRPMICHSCDNPKCLNPAHLFPGTAKTNNDDAFQKGRRNRRQIIPHRPKAKLSESQVLEVHNSQESDRILSLRFCVSVDTIWSIKTGKRWKTLTAGLQRTVPGFLLKPMTSYNRGYCYFCGKKVSEDDWTELGPNVRVWTCGSAECEREIQRDDRQAREELLGRYREEIGL